MKLLLVLCVGVGNFIELVEGVEIEVGGGFVVVVVW